ncbi:MAG: hypothetical protein ACREXW_13705 [Gammaproteobacteria bacterium]
MSAIPACALPRAARSSTTVYRPRRPEKTVVYQVVQKHLETWLAHTREAEPDGDPVPRFVERDLRRYLDCGTNRASRRLVEQQELGGEGECACYSHALLHAVG